MMLLWMLYVVVVSLLLSGAVLAAERIALVAHTPTRWHWVLSIAASALVPLRLSLRRGSTFLISRISSARWRLRNSIQCL